MTATIDRSTSLPTDEQEVREPPLTSPPLPEPTRRRLTALLWAGVVVSLPIALVAALIIPSMLGSGDDPLLVVDGSGLVSRLDVGETRPTYTLDGASVSADGSTIFQSEVTSGGTTEVRQIDPKSGEATTTAVVLGDAREIRTVSPNGDAVALLPVVEADLDLYEPVPRLRTPIDVLFSDGREPVSFDLAGNFEPETFNRDATVLYLLEFFPAEAPDRYFVRQLDLTTGEISEVYSPNVELAPQMRGQARAQVLAPDFSYLYTLYTLEPDDDPLTDPTATGDTDRWSFVHVLSLDEDWSFCIFLPVPIGTTARSELSMAIAPDGLNLFVVDRVTGTIAVIDTTNFVVRGTADSTTLRPGDDSEPSSAVGVDGRLYTTNGNGILAYSSDLTQPEQVWWSAGERVTDLQASAAGSQLRVAMGNKVVIFDVDRNETVATLAVPGDGASFVGPPGQSVSISEGPLECAC
ncbi:MAG: hypothetical protein V3V01_11215 [Acidimicrobiales bacterium]